PTPTRACAVFVLGSARGRCSREGRALRDADALGRALRGRGEALFLGSSAERAQPLARDLEGAGALVDADHVAGEPRAHGERGADAAVWVEHEIAGLRARFDEP